MVSSRFYQLKSAFAVNQYQYMASEASTLDLFSFFVLFLLLD